jgi:glycosyltransferase involved in cell wall biosynthesis
VEEEVCNLLFVGVNWFRKGGDVAYKTFKRLKSQGFKCRLFLVGCDVTLPEYDPDVEHIPFLNKNNRQEFDKLYEIYSQSHFLLLPTIADCTPIVFSEAAAFGIPVLTNDTGGNSSVVCEGVTGYLFPAGADENIYADTIKSVFTDKELYLTLRRNSRIEYDRRLSWNVWINKVNRLIGANGAPEIDESNKETYYYEEGY